LARLKGAIGNPLGAIQSLQVLQYDSHHRLVPLSMLRGSAMKMIALLAVIAMLLVDIFGPKSSVGGSMTMGAVVILIILVVGIYEAASNKRGVLGWIVNIVAVVVGGFIAINIIGLLIDLIIPLLHLDTSLAKSDHPIKYVLTAGIAILVVLGTWAPLLIINRWRDRDRGVDTVTQG
jgi:hypothetical protein